MKNIMKLFKAAFKGSESLKTTNPKFKLNSFFNDSDPLKSLRILASALMCVLLVNAPTHAVETVTYYHHDALGSPVAATDDGGNLLWREDYMPYGERVRNPANATDNTLWYTGKPEEPALGLQYFGARWYDPSLGRFTGIDPVGFKQGNIHSFNRYAYANNNPYVFVDPDGNESVLAARARINSGQVLVGTQASLNSSFPQLNTPVPGFEPPRGGEVGFEVAGAMSGAGGVKSLLQWGAGKLALKRGSDDLVNLASPQRTKHILVGDGPGSGGHLWPGQLGKTPFPKDWSGGKIMDAISDIATDPNIPWMQITGKSGSKFTKSGKPVRFKAEGTRDGVNIKTIIEPQGEGIITGYPN